MSRSGIEKSERGDWNTRTENSDLGVSAGSWLMAILSSQRMIIWLLSVPGPFHVSIKLGASEWWKYRTSILTLPLVSPWVLHFWRWGWRPSSLMIMSLLRYTWTPSTDVTQILYCPDSRTSGMPKNTAMKFLFGVRGWYRLNSATPCMLIQGTDTPSPTRSSAKRAGMFTRLPVAENICMVHWVALRGMSLMVRILRDLARLFQPSHERHGTSAGPSYVIELPEK
mmetsp:Transcript_63553/g.151546  ORF Transcript_63553/g.151546 Transcript_63553/m.151546 type:complete len:225 (+) Transcript_63553:539-1213(+)